MRVLVCDRLSIVRHGLSALLAAEEDIEVIDETGSGIDAMVLARRHQPHVVVTGLALDGISGLELVRRLNQEDLDPKPRVVVLSMMENEDTISRVLHAGANGLLVKEVTREQLGSAVRAAADGQTMLAPQVATRLVDWFRRQEAPTETPLQSEVESLTAREREVLTLFARGLSIEEVASELFIGTTTVRTHVYRLRCKLGLKDRAQLVSFAYRAGLMQEARRLGPGGSDRPPAVRPPADGSSGRRTVPGADRKSRPPVDGPARRTPANGRVANGRPPVDGQGRGASVNRRPMNGRPSHDGSPGSGLVGGRSANGRPVVDGAGRGASVNGRNGTGRPPADGRSADARRFDADTTERSTGATRTRT
ncbi:response regulator [Actinoallomurus sp. NPDC052274]|uniref:response regulator n=1 Tax=Actinoallomurus sp. NPDC052274 TaxID=3155420 RepID=UPI003438FB4C